MAQEGFTFDCALLGSAKYVCPADNNCTINRLRKKSCQACRLRKCYEYGMSPGSKCHIIYILYFLISSVLSLSISFCLFCLSNSICFAPSFSVSPCLSLSVCLCPSAYLCLYLSFLIMAHMSHCLFS